jgi:hypothetical protein
MNPLPAPRALDQYFLEARARLLDVAAFLDRIGRGEHTALAEADPRLAKIARALAVLQTDVQNKAELIQKIFSQEYDANWPRPQPRL